VGRLYRNPPVVVGAFEGAAFQKLGRADHCLLQAINRRGFNRERSYTKTGSPSSDSIKKRFFKSVICEVLHTRQSIALSELTYREEI
jgi:hypothetical protein